MRAAPFIFAQIYLNQFERVWVCLLCVIWGYKIETLGLAFEYIIGGGLEIIAFNKILNPLRLACNHYGHIRKYAIN